VLSEGGHLEQYAPPAELLGNPTSDFVREFVGADRGIRRLAVTPVTTVMRPTSDADNLDEAPAVPRTATLYDALAAMLTAQAPQVVVCDGDTPVGSISRSEIFAAPAEAHG
jgi:osmoprotectant transport system ATP-binding protein